jgi:large subunit ribosomal protein L17
MAVAVFTHGRITTTLAKAKEMRAYVERLITLAKKGLMAKEAGQEERHLHCYRRAISELQDKDIAKKLFTEIAPGYRDRAGGYTRVLRDSGHRLGDNAPKAIFELVEFQGAEPAEPEKKKKGRKKKVKS